MAHDPLMNALQWSDETLRTGHLRANILKEIPRWPLHPKMVKRQLINFNRTLRREAVGWIDQSEETVINPWKAWATLIVDQFDWTGHEDIKKRVADLLSRRLIRAQLLREQTLAKRTACPANP